MKPIYEALEPGKIVTLHVLRSWAEQQGLLA
jgi:hypothetical protein